MSQNFSFSVILEPQEAGEFTVLVPALPEVVTEGDTEQEALINAEEAIRAVLEYRRENGLAIPRRRRARDSTRHRRRVIAQCTVPSNYFGGSPTVIGMAAK